MYPNPSQQAGFSMPVVVFVLVVMALLAVAITQLGSRSNIAVAREELATRALFAAESGAQWAASRLLFNALGEADKTFSDTACIAANGQLLNFTEDGLKSCSATISCKDNSLGSKGFYTLSIEGQCGVGQAIGQRVIEVGVQNAP